MCNDNVDFNKDIIIIKTIINHCNLPFITEENLMKNTIKIPIIAPTM
jgi:hypothetical protein